MKHHPVSWCTRLGCVAFLPACHLLLQVFWQKLQKVWYQWYVSSIKKYCWYVSYQNQQTICTPYEQLLYYIVCQSSFIDKRHNYWQALRFFFLTPACHITLKGSLWAYLLWATKITWQRSKSPVFMSRQPNCSPERAKNEATNQIDASCAKCQQLLPQFVATTFVALCVMWVCCQLAVVLLHSVVSMAMCIVYQVDTCCWYQGCGGHWAILPPPPLESKFYLRYRIKAQVSLWTMTD